MNTAVHLSALHLFPVKSCAGIAVAQALAGPRGLQVGAVLDRSWMVVDAHGVMVSQREEARLALVRTRLLHDAAGQATGVWVEAPGLPPLGLTAALVRPSVCQAIVHGHPVRVHETTPAAGDWFSRWLDRPVRLVHQTGDDLRPVAAGYTEAASASVVSLADGFQYLLASASTLAQLQAAVSATDLPMTRFRPNLVVSGSAPDAEYGWRQLRIGAATFALVKACERCVVTTIDPGTGERSGKQPLAALARSHFLDMPTPEGGRIHGAIFGENAVAVLPGQVAVGDAVHVIASGAPRPFRQPR